MIDVLISGKVRGTPTVRTSANGNPFATFKLAAADKTGEGVLCSCIAFSASVIQAVEKLTDGDSISVTGEAAISTWRGGDGTERRGLDVTVYGVLTAYHVGRKRRATDLQPVEGTGDDSGV